MRGPIVDIPKERRIVWESMDIVARCSERWQNVELLLRTMFHQNICFVPTKFPLLVSMTIYQARTNTYHEFVKEANSIICNAPNLRHVHLDESIARCLAFPLDQIITFSYSGKSNPQEFLQALNAPNLVECKFDYIRDKLNWDHTQLPIVTAVQLKKLEICSKYSRIIDKLTIPAARELSVEVRIDFPHTVFTSLVSRSGCHLMRLSLSGITLDASQLAECLQATPLLTEFQLNLAVDPEPSDISINEVLSVLTLYQISQATLLPNLESFICIYNGASAGHQRLELDLSVLAAMARSRWNYSSWTSASFKVAQLKSIYMEILYMYYSDEDSDGSDEESPEPDEDPGDETFREMDQRQNFGNPIPTDNMAAELGELIAEGMNIQIKHMARRIL